MINTDPDYIAGLRALESLDYHLALHHAKQATARHRNDPDAMMLLAEALVGTEQARSAVTHLR